MKKYEGGGNVFNKTSEELKQMSPKERRQFERQRAYNEGLKNAEKGTVKGSISQAVDQTLGPQTTGERMMRSKGYKDRKKAGEYQEKANKKLKSPPNEGVKKLPKDVRNKMGYMKCGGKVHKMKKGGSVKKCKRDGIAVRGKTRAGR